MRIPRIAIGIGFLLLALVLMVIGKVPAVLSLVYLLMSAVSYIAYVLEEMGSEWSFSVMVIE